MTESIILVKWYAVIHMTKNSNRFFIQKVLQCFRNEKNSPVKSVTFRCLSNDTPDHLPGIGVFKIEDLYGPVQILPLKGNELDALNNTSIVHYFQAVSTLDRTQIIGILLTLIITLKTSVYELNYFMDFIVNLVLKDITLLKRFVSFYIFN